MPVRPQFNITESDQLIAMINYADSNAAIDDQLRFDQTLPGPGNSQLLPAINQQYVAITDGRASISQGKEFSLEKQGFELVQPGFCLSPLRPFFQQLDMQSDEQAQQRDILIRQQSYPQFEHYLLNKLGAQQILTFDHTIRANGSNAREQSTQRRAPVKTVHNDYTSMSANRQLKQTLEKHKLPADDFRYFQFVNIWIPLLNPVEESPLAVMDIRSASGRDFHDLKVIYPHREGQISVLSANPTHCWYWFSHMQPDEALLLRVFDSRYRGNITGVPHTAFDLPQRSANQPVRQRISLEVRTIALFR